MPDPTVQDLIRQEAQKQGVPPELALAVAQQESGFNPTAQNPAAVKGEHALGTFQLLPSTAKGLGIDPADPMQNIQGGVKYLRQLMDQHQGDLQQVLAAYGGVRTDQKYVPSVLGRMQQFRTVGTPPPAPSVKAAAGGPPAPVSTFGRLRQMAGSVLEGFNPLTAEGRQNLAGGAGALALPAIAGLFTEGASLPATSALSVAGAGLGGGLEQAGEDLMHGRMPSLSSSLGPAETQAGYDIGGQVVGGLIGAIGRRVIAPGVARTATERLAGLKSSTADALAKVLDQAKQAISNSGAGRLVQETLEGPVKDAQTQLGEAVASAAKSGPTVNAQPILDKLQKLRAEITPSVGEAPGQLIGPGGAVMTATDLPKLAASHPDLFIPPDHPLPGVLSRIENVLSQNPQAVPFNDLHIVKQMADDAVNWDSPARKKVQQLTKGLRQSIRSTMADAGHEPYEQATQAYSDFMDLQRNKTLASSFRKQAQANPESIVSLIKGSEPTKAQALHDLLMTAPSGQTPDQGEAAWNAVRAAWTRANLAEGDIKTLSRRIGKMDPDFVKTMYGDPQGQMILGRYQQLAQAWNDATAKQTAFAETSLAKRANQTTRQIAIDAAHLALYPHSPFTPVRLADMIGVHGVKPADLLEWASLSPLHTRMLAHAFASPLRGPAIADVARYAFGGGPEPMPSHAPSGPPPTPTSLQASTPPPAPTTSTPPPKPTSNDTPDYGYGPRWNEATQSYSGPPKGLGWFGPLMRPDSDPAHPTVQSEYSIDREINGHNVSMPSIVPTLTPEELQFILTSNDQTPLPPSIERKAIAYAKQRIAEGKSPFAGPGEQRYDLYPQFHRAPEPPIRRH